MHTGRSFDWSRVKNVGIVKYVLVNMGMLIGLLLVGGYFSITSDVFLSGGNIVNVLRQISMNAIIAFGMTNVILIGGIDLSVGSIVAATGCASVAIIQSGAPVLVGILGGLVLGGIIGLANGVIISKGKLPSFIVTLAMMTIARGLAYVYTDGKPMTINSAGFDMVGNGYLGSIPIPAIIMVVLLIICSTILNRTRFGRNIYAIGGNREAARVSGIRTSRVEILVFTISGFMSGVAGLILASRMSSGQPMVGSGMELDAIAAVVLGGTSFSGGIGSVGGTILGALVIGILSNGLNLIHVSFYWQLVVKGVVIILAVYIDSIKKSKK